MVIIQTKRLLWTPAASLMTPRPVPSSFGHLSRPTIISPLGREGPDLDWRQTNPFHSVLPGGQSDIFGIFCNKSAMLPHSASPPTPGERKNRRSLFHSRCPLNCILIWKSITMRYASPDARKAWQIAPIKYLAHNSFRIWEKRNDQPGPNAFAGEL